MSDQIKALAGCDNLTISPKLLEALGQEEAELPRALSPDSASGVETVDDGRGVSSGGN